MSIRLEVEVPPEEKLVGIIEGVTEFSKESSGGIEVLKEHFSVVTVDNFLKLALIISAILLARIIWRMTSGLRKASWIKDEAKVVSGKARKKHYILTVSDRVNETQKIKVNYPIGVGEMVPIVRGPRDAISADPTWFAFPRASLPKELFKGVLGLVMYLWIISFSWTMFGIFLAITH